MIITIPHELEQELAKLAGSSGRDPKDLAAEALRRFIDYETKMEGLRAAVDAGDASGIFEGDPFESVRADLGLKPR